MVEVLEAKDIGEKRAVLLSVRTAISNFSSGVSLWHVGPVGYRDPYFYMNGDSVTPDRIFEEVFGKLSAGMLAQRELPL